MKQPNLNTDFGWCVFKYMFIALLATNLLWAGIFTYYVHKSVGDIHTTADVWQEGESNNNNQSITNG